MYGSSAISKGLKKPQLHKKYISDSEKKGNLMLFQQKVIHKFNRSNDAHKKNIKIIFCSKMYYFSMNQVFKKKRLFRIFQESFLYKWSWNY